MSFVNPDKPSSTGKVVAAVMALAIASGVAIAWHNGVFNSPPPAPVKVDTEVPIAPPSAPATPTKAGKKGAKADPAMVSPVTGKPVPDKDRKPLVNLH
jgi:hypothetical protein